MVRGQDSLNSGCRLANAKASSSINMDSPKHSFAETLTMLLWLKHYYANYSYSNAIIMNLFSSKRIKIIATRILFL